MSQVLSVGCGLGGRKAQARSERGWSLQMNCAGSGGGGLVACQETQRRPEGFGFWKVCVLFTVGLQASSLWRFLLLMRVPSGLLRVSWPGPRKEMMQLASSTSLRLGLNSEHQKRGTSAEAPVGL